MLRSLSALLLCATAAALAQTQPVNGKSGVEPGPDAGAYAAKDSTTGVSMGASVLTNRQIHHIFNNGLKGDYIVVVVAIYPESQVSVSPDQFRLRLASEPGLLRAMEPGEVARHVLGVKKTPTAGGVPSRLQVWNTETVGYEHGPYGRHGVYAESSTSVGIGDPQLGGAGPAPLPPDATELERTLVELGLADTKTSTPIAGYLYFRKPPMHGKPATYNLTWYGPMAQLHVAVPAPR